MTGAVSSADGTGPTEPRGPARGLARGPAADPDRGAGSVLVVGLVAVAVALAALLGVLARAQGAHLVARSAADLAALAAASVLVAPPGVVVADPAASPAASCALAGEVAARNGGTLARCTALGDGVVQVTVTHGSALGTASAVARAGPAWARGP